jgi:Tfp pilus assembly protein PilN
MIKVNLIGTGRKKPARTGVSFSVPVTITPILLTLIVVGFGVAGYMWYSDLAKQSGDLDERIRVGEQQKATLEAVIKQDQIYEGRKKALENRVRIVEGLQKNQISPVSELDQVAEAIEKTQYVWLSSLDQRDAAINMSGTGTSLNAIADFYSSLNATGYFKNLDLGPSQETSGNFTFSIKAEFSPPRNAEAAASTTTAGVN